MSLKPLAEKLRQLEKAAVFRTFSYIAGIVAIILIISGLFIPAWIVFKMQISTLGIQNTALNAQNILSQPSSPPSEMMAEKMGLVTNSSKQLQSPQDGQQRQQGLPKQQGNSSPVSNADFNPDAEAPRAPALNLNMRHIEIRTAAYIGLWHVTACVDAGDVSVGEHCVTMTMDKFASSLMRRSSVVAVQGMQVFFGHLEAMQALMITSCVLAVGGMVLLFLYHRREDTFSEVKTNIGILCCICWGLAALLIFGAVAAEGHQNSNMYSSTSMMKAVNPASQHFDMNVHFPWALLISSFGAIFCITVLLTLAIWMCKAPLVTDKKNPGDWHEFSNQSQTA